MNTLAPLPVAQDGDSLKKQTDLVLARGDEEYVRELYEQTQFRLAGVGFGKMGMEPHEIANDPKQPDPKFVTALEQSSARLQTWLEKNS